MNRREIWTAVPRVEKYKIGAAAVQILEKIRFILFRDDSFKNGQSNMRRFIGERSATVTLKKHSAMICSIFGICVWLNAAIYIYWIHHIFLHSSSRVLTTLNTFQLHIGIDLYFFLISMVQCINVAISTPGCCRGHQLRPGQQHRGLCSQVIRSNLMKHQNKSDRPIDA